MQDSNTARQWLTTLYSAVPTMIVGMALLLSIQGSTDRSARVVKAAAPQHQAVQTANTGGTYTSTSSLPDLW